MVLGDSTLDSLTPLVNAPSINKKFSVTGEHFISGIIASLKRKEEADYNYLYNCLLHLQSRQEAAYFLPLTLP
jgi:hypothetical protein